MNLNGPVRLIEMIPGDASVPAPAPVSGAETQEPPDPLLSMAHHVRQVPHDAPEVAAVDVREEAGVGGCVGGILKHTARRFGKVLDRPVPV